MTLHPLVETLRDARLDAGLTQVELACLVGTSQSAISEMEAGLTTPWVSTVDKVAAVFGLVPILVPKVDS